MFEAVNSITSRVPGGEIPSAQVVPLRSPGPGTPNVNVSEDVISPTEQASQAMQKAEEQSQQEQVTEEMLVDLERDIETVHSIGLRFSKHDESGRTMIKVMDKRNEELIREIPSEQVLNLAAKIEEMIGILFDKRA